MCVHNLNMLYVSPSLSPRKHDNRFCFCRIPEEEWDKYIIPAKSDSEKYKVSRTFSFIMNRMTSPRNKSKVVTVLCLSAIKHRWLSFSATSVVSPPPSKSVTSDFIYIFENLYVFYGILSKSAIFNFFHLIAYILIAKILQHTKKHIFLLI